MDIPDESVRAPMRAHILASINPFLGGGTASGLFNGQSHSKRPGRRRRRRSSEKANGDYRQHDDDGSGDDKKDDDLRPRSSKIRFKSRRQEKAGQEGGDHGDQDGSQTTRYRSRDYETDSDKGYSAVDDRGAERQNHKSGTESRAGDEDLTPKDTPNGEEPTKEGDHSRRHHRRHRHHHRRHHKRSGRSRSRSPPSTEDHRDKKQKKHTTSEDGKGEQEEEGEDPYASAPLDPDAAFRQSLFDAMADDEGAAYWEAVYGQPVHEYAEEARQRQEAASGQAGQDGKKGDPDGISAMNDEEYADYVRHRMWERSQEGRREARENQKRQQAAAAAADKKRLRTKQRAFEQDRLHWAAVERSLRRGEARRQRRRWQDRWQSYATAWAGWEASPSPATIPWPVERAAPAAGEEKGAETADKASEEAYAKEVRAFFTGGPQDDDDDNGNEKNEPTTEKSLLARLRDERVRWHPDKMQQRLGGSVDAAAMRDITAIFQVVDRLWSELRGKK